MAHWGVGYCLSLPSQISSSTLGSKDCPTGELSFAKLKRKKKKKKGCADKKEARSELFEELFLCPSELKQRIVGGGGTVRGRHPLETVRFAACVKAQSARD